MTERFKGAEAQRCIDLKPGQEKSIVSVKFTSLSKEYENLAFRV